MGNLKLIKTTGKPFSPGSINKIGIDLGGGKFKIITAGGLVHQESSSKDSYRPATAEEIAENWKLIHPHWTPEKGDRVIITQDYCDWTNCKATIIAKNSSKNYYQVQRNDGHYNIFDYTSQMILAPTTPSIVTETNTSEAKSESPVDWKWQDLKVGDKVKITGGSYSSRPVGSILTIAKMEDKDYEGSQPIKLIGSDGEDKGWPNIGNFEPYYGTVEEPEVEPEVTSIEGFKLGDRVICTETGCPRTNKTGTVVHLDVRHIGVAYDDYCSGHECNGRCEDGKGWYSLPKDLQHYIEPKKETKVETKQETMAKFKIGDRVKCIHRDIKGYGKVGTVLKGGDTSCGVRFDETIGGHTLDGTCTDGYGWYIDNTSLELSYESAPTEATKNTFKLGDLVVAKEGPFKGIAGEVKDLRGGRFGVQHEEKAPSTGPQGHHLNNECPNGYGWYYDYSELELMSRPSSKSEGTLKVKSEPLKKFRVGDKVTYKSKAECKDRCYHFSGEDQGGFVGEVLREGSYRPEFGCYDLSVTIRDGGSYCMLESEFYEYDGTKLRFPETPKTLEKPEKPEKPKPQFYVGKSVTYKSKGLGYYFGGADQEGFVGLVKEVQGYEEAKGCYKIKVTTKQGDYPYSMLESEFEEYNNPTYITGPSSYPGSVVVTTPSPSIGLTVTSVKSSDPLSLYKQSPITAKPKPKAKLTVI